MSVARRWSDLSPRARKIIVAGAVAESALKAVALVDLKRRPASEIRGPKWAWLPGLTVVNSAGIIPLAYLVRGRRKPSGPG
jgi:type II secretory pathway component PulM